MSDWEQEKVDQRDGDFNIQVMRITIHLLNLPLI
jgi:hypothetical protein